MHRILILMGTRPEVIKLAPLVLELKRSKSLDPIVCLSGQHIHIAQQMLDHFGLKPDVSFEIPRSNGNLTGLVAGLAAELSNHIGKFRYDMIVVQGDTTSAMMGAIVGFYEDIPVAHIEAGLRSFDVKQPYPEEFNRRVISLAASLHLCPTTISRKNLVKEKVDPSRIHVVGNTCIDALFWTLRRTTPAASIFKKASRGLLVTGHRRENWDKGLREMCLALKDIAQSSPDLDIVYTVHPNPHVQRIAEDVLKDIENVRLLPPLAYPEFCRAMKEAYLIISDSGGVQEEALALGTPVLVTRNVTERPEVLRWETVKLVGSKRDNIVQAADYLIHSEKNHRRAAKPHYPFGKGDACNKISHILQQYFSAKTSQTSPRDI